METSKYTLHTYWRRSAGEKDLFSTRALLPVKLSQNVSLLWPTESDFSFELQDTEPQSACWNTQELEWRFWQSLSLSLSLSVFYIPSLTASARDSLPFPYSASPRAKSWALVSSVLLPSSLHPIPAATLPNLCQESLCSELHVGGGRGERGRIKRGRKKSRETERNSQTGWKRR